MIKKAIAEIASLKNALRSVYLIKERQQTLQASVLDNTGWQTISLEELPAPGAFSRIVLLIPDQQTVFRHITFSTDLVSNKDLEEAISLNIESWSPYGKDVCAMSVYTRKQGQWLVAVWLWPQSAQDRLLHALPEQHVTHIMPELAWHCARVTRAEPTLLIARGGRKAAYVYLNEEGLPVHITWPENEAEATRFWRSLGTETDKIKRIILTEITSSEPPPGLPAHLEQTLLEKPTAKSNWLKRAQCEGVHDWLDPANWLTPALAVLSLLIIWAGTDALLIYQQNQQAARLIHQARQTNQNVIQQQEAISQSRTQLLHYAQLRRRQQQPERILAELSTRIPNDIWLEVIQLDQRWLDIRGRGKDVIRLLALLEAIPGVEDIVLLNDVRPDARTGDEQFQIRLILTDMNIIQESTPA